MEFSEVYIEEQEKIENKSSFINNISKELSLIGWVAIVFMLILLSYFENEYVLQKNVDIDIHTLSISEKINEELSLESKKM